MPLIDTTTWLAQAIREAREQRGWSQSELASRLNKTQTAVSYWEAGKRTPGVDDLLELSEALDVPLDRFFPPDRTRRPVAAVLRATAARLADHELSHAIDELLDKAEQVPMALPELAVTASAPTTAAHELLEKAAMEDPPVDIQELAVRCGALVLYRSFPDSLSGLLFAHGEGAVIGINAQHSSRRQRFSLGHELGHYVLGHHRRETGQESRFHLDSAEGTTPGFDWRAERAANEFAAEILMPRKMISRAVENSSEPAALAELFEVSELAMGYRLVNLGLR